MLKTSQKPPAAGSLYRLLVLSRAFSVAIEPKLRESGLERLPGDLRDRLK